MSHNACWVIDKYEYRACREPQREFCSVASLHNHSCHSIENLASLNRVMTLPYMRPFRRLLQRSFGLEAEKGLDYSDLKYNPPFAPADVWRMEHQSARRLGFDRLLLAITDHDCILGGLKLLKEMSARQKEIALGEELSIRFQNHLFHLGVTGIPPSEIEGVHPELLKASREGRLSDLFESLRALKCLVILNHPFLPWDGDRSRPIPVLELLERFGWAIHALEYNGMRCHSENDDVMRLARHARKPLVGGGDSHLLEASSVLCASTMAMDASNCAEAIKSGLTMPLIKSDYFAPLNWKLTLRVLSFIGLYRKIAHYKGSPIQSMIGGRWILLDPVGGLARIFLRLAAGFGMVR